MRFNPSDKAELGRQSNCQQAQILIATPALHEIMRSPHFINSLFQSAHHYLIGCFLTTTVQCRCLF